MNDAAAPYKRISPPFLRSDDQRTFTANERRLLDLVRQEQALSRAEMARTTGLAMPSVVRLVDGLIERGFLKAGEKVVKGPGQPSLPIGLVPDAAFTFGVSIMTDAVSVVLMDLAGVVRATGYDTIDVDDRPGVIRHVQTALRRMTSEAALDPARVFGIGVAATGYFIGQGALNTPSSMPQWAQIDLEAELGKAFQLPVWIENDGNAAAAGESLYGVGRRHRDFAYIYVAGGLGGGLVRDGSVWRGHRGNAGELTGILPVEARDERPTLSLLLAVLREHGVALSGIGELVERFQGDWPGVDEWLARTQGALKAILSAISAVEDPDVIVVGGRSPRALTQRLVAQAAFYETRLRSRERAFPLVIAAEADGDAAALGAAAIPFKQHFFG
jgi:predicted NBD/HSP70 family sugar kinase